MNTTSMKKRRKPARTPQPYTRRRGPAPAARLLAPDYPYTMRLPDGRTVAVEIPGRWVTADRDGSPLFRPEAARFLDQLRALFVGRTDRPMTPGYIRSLREALGLSQVEFGAKLGVAGLAVSFWETSRKRPGAKSRAAMEKLRREALQSGVLLPG